MQQPPYDNAVLFLDDKREYIQQVERACAVAGVPSYSVHVNTDKMTDRAAYDAALRRCGVCLAHPHAHNRGGSVTRSTLCCAIL